MSLQFRGSYRSLNKFDWHDIPPLTVITGKNGVGKSQLLELLASEYGALKNEKWRVQPAKVNAEAILVGETFQPGEVFHSYGEWEPLENEETSEARIRGAIHELQQDRLKPFHISTLTKDLGVSEQRLRTLTPKEFAELITPSVLWSYASARNRSLSFLFLAYRYFQRSELLLNADETRSRPALGEPPWSLLAAIIDAAGLAFRLNVPGMLPNERYETDEHFDFQLTDRSGRKVPLSQLSSGERVIMSTVLWRYQAEVAQRHYKLLLLDEPDAHLHPSLTRRFLNVLKKVWLFRFKCG